MEITRKITLTLLEIAGELQAHIIGASALILSGVEIGDTADIVILTIRAGFDTL